MAIPEFFADLMQKRDELRVHLQLAGKEAEQEWDELTKEWDEFLTKAQFEKSSEEVGEAARHLGLRMKAAYDRLRNAMD